MDKRERHLLPDNKVPQFGFWTTCMTAVARLLQAYVFHSSVFYLSNVLRLAPRGYKTSRGRIQDKKKLLSCPSTQSTITWLQLSRRGCINEKLFFWWHSYEIMQLVVLNTWKKSKKRIGLFFSLNGDTHDEAYTKICPLSSPLGQFQ